jgi:hypothetical protein
MARWPLLRWRRLARAHRAAPFFRRQALKAAREDAEAVAVMAWDFTSHAWEVLLATVSPITRLPQQLPYTRLDAATARTGSRLPVKLTSRRLVAAVHQVNSCDVGVSGSRLDYLSRTIRRRPDAPAERTVRLNGRVPACRW